VSCFVAGLVVAVHGAIRKCQWTVPEDARKRVTGNGYRPKLDRYRATHDHVSVPADGTARGATPPGFGAGIAGGVPTGRW